MAESVFIITELRQTGTGAVVDTPTVLRWTSADRAAPRGVFEHTLTVLTHREEVPGSDRPVEQVMSSSWEPFDLQGAWDDRHAGAGFAMATYRAVSELAARGPLVRVQVDRLTFVGVIVKVAIRYQRATQIGWTITLSPHRNEAVAGPRDTMGTARAPVPAPIEHRAAAVDALVGSMTEAHESAASAPAATELHTEAGLDLEAVQGAATRIREALAGGFEEDALSRLATIGALFRGVRGAAMAIPARLGRARSTATVAYDDVALTLLHEEWVRNVAADARRAAMQSEKADEDVARRVSQRPIAIHRATAGESLPRISQRYYGTTAGWRTIYLVNGLSSLTLAGGEDLVIPEASR